MGKTEGDPYEIQSLHKKVVGTISGGATIQPSASNYMESNADHDFSRSMASSFVKKLFEMVDNESDDIISWVYDGTAFEVKDPKRLEAEILPNFFRHSRFQSLVRQLNFYAFKKVSKERSSWVYSHSHFQKHRPDLLDKLRRKTNGIAVKRSSDYNIENTLKRKKRRTLSREKYSSDDSSDESSDVGHYEGREVKRTNSFGGDSAKYWVDFPFDEPYKSLEHGDCDYSGDEDASSVEECDQVNYENIHRSWDNVHQFFTEKSGSEEERGEEDLVSLSSDNGSVYLGDHVLPNTLSDDFTAQSNSPSGSPSTMCLTPLVGLRVPSDERDYLHRLFCFCTGRNPWLHSHDLFADIHTLLTEDARITRELNAYVSALSPSSLAIRSVSYVNTISPLLERELSREDEKVQIHPRSILSPSPCQTTSCILKANEVTLVRNFMAFALACMHELEEEQQWAKRENEVYITGELLSSCADRWASYARVCS